MSYQKQSFGMMDEGYFVPRGQLIDWINQLLDLSITKIQQCGAGSIYCQIVDVIHPGKVAMNKVNWKAKNDYEFINNLKILQTAFEKAGVKRYVDVQKLAKAKYQDNLQFIQWLKRYYDLNCGDRGNDYNPKQRRGNCAVDLGFADKSIVPKSYNSGGQVLSKNQLPGKKVNANIPSKGPVEVKPEPPKVQRKPQTKPSVKMQRKPEVRSPPRVQKKRQETKPIQSKNKIQEGTNKKQVDWKARCHEEVQKNKDLNLKIGMIEEVLRSDEGSDLKIAMLEEILAIVRHQKPEAHDNEVQATHGEDQHQGYEHNEDQHEEDEII